MFISLFFMVSVWLIMCELVNLMCVCVCVCVCVSVVVVYRA